MSVNIIKTKLGDYFGGETGFPPYFVRGNCRYMAAQKNYPKLGPEKSFDLVPVGSRV